jgi:hypothetical protein
MAEEYILKIPIIGTDNDTTPRSMTKSLLEHLKGEYLFENKKGGVSILTTSIDGAYLVVDGDGYTLLATTKKAEKKIKKIEKGLEKLATLNDNWLDNIKNMVDGKE